MKSVNLDSAGIWMECTPKEIWKSLLLSSQRHSRYLRTTKVNSGELWGNGQWRELPSTGGRQWTPSSALRFLRTQWPQYSQRLHRSYFQPVCEFLRTPRQGSGRPPQTSLCLGPADFCSCRTDDRPSPDPLEPLLMGGLARLTPANPPGPLLALFVEGGDVLLDPVGFGGLRRWDCQSGWPRLGWGICFCYSVPWGLRGPAVVSCSPWQLCRRE